MNMILLLLLGELLRLARQIEFILYSWSSHNKHSIGLRKATNVFHLIYLFSICNTKIKAKLCDNLSLSYIFPIFIFSPFPLPSLSSSFLNSFSPQLMWTPGSEF